jgi:hypothetical protein
VKPVLGRRSTAGRADGVRLQFTNVEDVGDFKGPMNVFVNVPAYPTAEMKTVVRPNFDTLYSSAWLDLTKEPMLVSVPDTDGRYYLLPMLDMWTDVFASPGWRTTGTGAQTFLVTPPGWIGTVPDGVAQINASTPYVWIIGRIKTDSPADYDAVHKIQAGLRLRPLLEAKDIAKEGFIYGLPIVMNYAVMYAYAVDPDSGQFKAPFNEIKNEAQVFTYKDTAIVTPNSDTPYSFAWLDLRAEPIVLSVPAVEKDRYYAVQLEDGITFNYGYIGSRATGNEAGDYMVVGPDWQGETPPGIKKVFRSSTQFSVAGYRTQLFGPDDIDNVKKVQAGYKVRPLSAYLKQPAPPPAPNIDFPKIDKDLVKSNFFEYLDFALQFAPPGEDEKDIRAKLTQPNSNAPNVLAKSFTITADIKVPEDGGDGMIVTNGGRRLWALFAQGQAGVHPQPPRPREGSMGRRRSACSRQAYARIRLQIRRARHGQGRQRRPQGGRQGGRNQEPFRQHPGDPDDRRDPRHRFRHPHAGGRRRLPGAVPLHRDDQHGGLQARAVGTDA